jgi:16S rRNA (cytidine1402-2'-O)-methyltransferase
MKEGARVALVSDAGMPGISDPGHDLIVSALENGVEVTVIPGPSALISALVVSGMPTREFTFAGFPPRKAGERTRFVESALSSDRTIALFESPKRLVNLLGAIARLSPDRKMAVARELTKKFEEVLRGTAAELAAHFETREPRGELVIVLEASSGAPPLGAAADAASPVELVEQLIKKGMRKKEAMRETARRLGLSRRDVYDALLKEKQEE